jgi:hypothetical protein
MKRAFDVLKLVIIVHGTRRVNEAAQMNRYAALGFRRLEVNGRPLSVRLDGKRLELHGLRMGLPSFSKKNKSIFLYK